VLALLLLLKKKKKNKVYVVVGDGECNEGSIWEAVMSASHHQLNNLTIIVDNNGFQQTGSNNEINKQLKLKDKFASFGCETLEVDGHNIQHLLNAFEINSNLPKAIVAKTVKGKGFNFSENNNEWHHKILTKSAYEDAVKELNEKYGNRSKKN
jgi:transketolase